MELFWQQENIRLYLGDCREVLDSLPENSVDSVVCDPPYDLSFMGKSWDQKGIAFDPETWKKVLRVLKPGGHLLAFGGTRTYHRMACAIEDAGFEIRDSILAWIYGSGFPKSLDISKAIDRKRDDNSDILRVTSFLRESRQGIGLTAIARALGFEATNGTHGTAAFFTDDPRLARVPTWEQWMKLKEIFRFGHRMDAEVWRLNGRKGQPGEAWFEREVLETRHESGKRQIAILGIEEKDYQVTAPATEEAQEWEGWGTAIKPSYEPIVVARKPLSEDTVAENVLAWGTGGLNINGCRVGTEQTVTTRHGHSGDHGIYGGDSRKFERVNPPGRWPPNVVFSHSPECNGECVPGCPVRLLDEQSGERTSGKAGQNGHRRQASLHDTGDGWGMRHSEEAGTLYGDTGGASRFFPCFDPDPFLYCPKASRNERDAGCQNIGGR